MKHSWSRRSSPRNYPPSQSSGAAEVTKLCLEIKRVRQGWNATTKRIMAVGQDTLDWKKIFAVAKIGGIKNYFVKMDLEKMKASAPYLRGLQV